MGDRQLLSELEEIARQLELELRWEEGDFTGGLCRISNRRILIVNCSLPPVEQVRVLSRVLSEIDLSQIFILPAVRKLIDRF